MRLPERSGLVKARLRGIEEARGETFVVLDSHIEVQPGWLEPLLSRLHESPTSMVMPIIDSIDAATFEFTNQGIGCALASGIGMEAGRVHRHLLIAQAPLLHSPAEQQHQGADPGQQRHGAWIQAGGWPSQGS